MSTGQTVTVHFTPRVSLKQPSELRTVWTTASNGRRKTQLFQSPKHKRPLPGPLLFHGGWYERTTFPFRAEFCGPVFQKILQRRATRKNPETTPTTRQHVAHSLENIVLSKIDQTLGNMSTHSGRMELYSPTLSLHVTVLYTNSSGSHLSGTCLKNSTMIM